ncbi:hypothetical protein D3C84_1102560 [compost metagenome]
MQQAFLDDPVQLGVGREVDGVDVDQRAIGIAATGLDVLPTVALDLQRRAHIRLEQALTSAQGQGQHGHGSQFHKRHDDPCQAKVIGLGPSARPSVRH